MNNEVTLCINFNFSQNFQSDTSFYSDRILQEIHLGLDYHLYHRKFQLTVTAVTMKNAADRHKLDVLSMLCKKIDTWVLQKITYSKALAKVTDLPVG